MKQMIIAYRVLATLGVVLFLTGLVNLFYDWQLDGVQLMSVLLATGGIVCTGFASIMVDHCKIRAKTAWHIGHERKHKEAFYKPNLLPMDLVYPEEDGSKATCLPFAFTNGCEVLVNPSTVGGLEPPTDAAINRLRHRLPMMSDYKKANRASDYTINPAVDQTNEEIDEKVTAFLQDSPRSPEEKEMWHKLITESARAERDERCAKKLQQLQHLAHLIRKGEKGFNQ